MVNLSCGIYLRVKAIRYGILCASAYICAQYIVYIIYQLAHFGEYYIFGTVSVLRWHKHMLYKFTFIWYTKQLDKYCRFSGSLNSVLCSINIIVCKLRVHLSNIFFSPGFTTFSSAFRLLSHIQLSEILVPLHLSGEFFFHLLFFSQSFSLMYPRFGMIYFLFANI